MPYLGATDLSKLNFTFLLFLCICGNYQILTCGIFNKYTPFHPIIVHVTLYGTK